MAEESSSSGISFFGVLTILFIGLKLGGVIDWHWEYVLGPLWMPLALVIVVGGPIILLAMNSKTGAMLHACVSMITRA